MACYCYFPLETERQESYTEQPTPKKSKLVEASPFVWPFLAILLRKGLEAQTGSDTATIHLPVLKGDWGK